MMKKLLQERIDTRTSYTTISMAHEDNVSMTSSPLRYFLLMPPSCIAPSDAFSTLTSSIVCVGQILYPRRSYFVI